MQNMHFLSQVRTLCNKAMFDLPPGSACSSVLYSMFTCVPVPSSVFHPPVLFLVCLPVFPPTYPHVLPPPALQPVAHFCVITSHMSSTSWKVLDMAKKVCRHCFWYVSTRKIITLHHQPTKSMYIPRKSYIEVCVSVKRWLVVDIGVCIQPVPSPLKVCLEPVEKSMSHGIYPKVMVEKKRRKTKMLVHGMCHFVYAHNPCSLPKNYARTN